MEKRLEKSAGATNSATHPPGTRVLAKGSNARPDLEGAPGVLVEYISSRQKYKARTCCNLVRDPLLTLVLWQIQLDSGEAFAAAAGSFTVLSSGAPAQELLQPQARVKLYGLKARPELNGREGEIIKYDDSTQRYAVTTPCLLTSHCVTVFACLF